MSDGSIHIDTKIDDSGLKNALKEVESSLKDAARYFDTLGDAGKAAFKALSSQLSAVDASASITGDKIGALSKKKEILNTEIQRLISSGLKPEDLQVRALQNVYNNLTLAQTANAASHVKVKKTAMDLFASMRDVMQGPIQAGKMVIDVFKKIGQVADQLENAWAAQEEAVALLNATLKSTGADAWTSSKALQDMASSLQKVTKFGDESITSMQTVLLGFRNITGENFQKATVEILNMATVMKMDLTSAAQAVGKALDNPAQGMDSLSRQGFKFTQQEKEMMKAMQDAGDLAGAQKIILDELAKTYGGAAEAAGATGSALKTKMANALSDLNEEMGRAISSSGVVTGYRNAVMSIAQNWAAALKASNDYKDWLASQGSGTPVTLQATDQLAMLERQLAEVRGKRSSLALAMSGGWGAGPETEEERAIQASIDAVKAQIAQETLLANARTLRKDAEKAMEKSKSDAAAKALADAKAEEEYAARSTELAKDRAKIMETYHKELASIEYLFEKGIITEEQRAERSSAANSSAIESFAELKAVYGAMFGEENARMWFQPLIDRAEELNAVLSDFAEKHAAVSATVSAYTKDSAENQAEWNENMVGSIEYMDAMAESFGKEAPKIEDATTWLDAYDNGIQGLITGSMNDLVNAFFELSDAMSESLKTGDMTTWFGTFRSMMEQMQAEIPKMLAVAGLQAIIGGNMGLGAALLAAAGFTWVGSALTGLTKWLNDTIFGTGQTEMEEMIGTQLEGVQSKFESFEKSLANIGQDIGSMFVDNIMDGLSGEDLQYELQEYIRKMVTQMVVFSGTMQEDLAEIGAMINKAVLTGDTSAYAGISAMVGELYSNAETAALLADTLLTDAFSADTYYAGIGGTASSAIAATGSKSLSLNVNSDVVVDGEVLGKIAIKYQDKMLEAAYGS